MLRFKFQLFLSSFGVLMEVYDSEGRTKQTDYEKAKSQQCANTASRAYAPYFKTGDDQIPYNTGQ
jgi:hypothetical protein